MLDHLRLAIPVYPLYSKEYGTGTHYFIGDMLDYDLPCASRSVVRDDDGAVRARDLYAPYESLDTGFSSMAMKFYDEGRNRLPYVELKASPAKIFQCHNVFGSESIEQGAYQMIGLLAKAYPKLCSILDFDNIEVLHLDCTYSKRLPNQMMVQPVLDYLANCGSGHRKTRKVKFDNYVTWGNDDAELRAKAYGKYLEVKSQIAIMQKLSEKGDARAKKLYFELIKVQNLASALLRFEARVCKSYLTRYNYPTNLWDLIEYQNKHPNLLEIFWHKTFDPIFNTLKGEYMTFKNDYEVEQLLRSKLVNVTKTGRTTYTKANSVMAFYRTLRDKGFKEVHAEMLDGKISKATFYRNIKLLQDCGISRSHLQNLHNEKTGKIIPFIRMVDITKNEQLPPDFVEPISEYAPLFKEFLLTRKAA